MCLNARLGRPRFSARGSACSTKKLPQLGDRLCNLSTSSGLQQTATDEKQPTTTKESNSISIECSNQRRYLYDVVDTSTTTVRFCKAFNGHRVLQRREIKRRDSLPKPEKRERRSRLCCRLQQSSIGKSPQYFTASIEDYRCKTASL